MRVGLIWVVSFAWAWLAPASPGASLRLLAPFDLRPGVAAWPLVAAPVTAAEQKVNAQLRHRNQLLAQAVHDCDANAQDSRHTMGEPPLTAAELGQDWSRTITVTMQGPVYLSLIASDDSDCGGAHPDEGQTALVFDLERGELVNWAAMFPRAAGASTYHDSAGDGGDQAALILPALERQVRAASASDPDCRDVWQHPQPFLVWPDAAGGVTVAQPFDLSHAVQACADELDLTVAQAGKLGFSPALLAALAASHAATARSDPKPGHSSGSKR